MEKTPPLDFDGPFPFHHIVWRVDPIETRMAWAEQAIAAGHDLNAIYSASLDGNFPKDSQSRPLAEALFWPQNYNSATDRMDDLDLLQLFLDKGADPRLKDIRTTLNAVEEARAWRDSGGGGSHHRYWAQACKMLEARARELDGKKCVFYFLALVQSRLTQRFRSRCYGRGQASPWDSVSLEMAARPNRC